MRNGYMAYLACVVESEKKKEILKDIHVVREFPDVFPKELPRLLQKKKIEVSIETLPRIVPIVQTPYRMVLARLVELKVQLQELLDKGFIRSSVSS
jgi:hypothetical protein